MGDDTQKWHAYEWEMALKNEHNTNLLMYVIPDVY